MLFGFTVVVVPFCLLFVSFEINYEKKKETILRKEVEQFDPEVTIT